MGRLVFLVPLLAAAGLGGAAEAHAFLRSASPRVGAQLAAAPRALRLSFSEPVEAGLSRITVSGPPGFSGAGAVRAAADDPAALVAPLPGAMPTGRYLVQWRVISADSHPTQGRFQFEVRP
jgi:methionine-rich copper-binding protein CopC